MSSCGSCDALGRDRCPTHRPAMTSCTVSAPERHKCRVIRLYPSGPWLANCQRCPFHRIDADRSSVVDDALSHWYFTREYVS